TPSATLCSEVPAVRRGTLLAVGSVLHNARGGGIDLPEELRKELADFDKRSRGLSHYEVLCVGADADAGSVRRAYLERSRRYHPDAWYGKNLGDYGPLLSKAFQRLSTAYQVLGDEDLRAQYDKQTAAKLSANDRAAVERRKLSREEEERRHREGRERLLRSKGFARIAAARQLYQDAVSMAEDGALGAARCAFAAGEVQKASTFAAKAADIAPRGEMEARLLLGKAFIELGFKAKARHELTLVLSQHPEHKEARALLKRV